MRLFIAANFDENIIDRLVELQADLKECGLEGNFTRPENLHLTLAFIGEYGNPDDVLDVLEDVAFRPVQLHAEGLQHYREMYLLKMGNHPGLESCVRRMRRALSEQGIPFDRKKFSPHITLARKVSFRKGRFEPPECLPEFPIPVERVSLMHSERGKRGMVYTELGCLNF